VTVVKSALVVKRERHLCINTEARRLIYTLMSLKNNREKKCVSFGERGRCIKVLSIFYLGIVLGWRIYLEYIFGFSSPRGLVMSPRPSPVVNMMWVESRRWLHFRDNLNMCYRLVSQVCISRWAYMIVRPKSLRVGGQGPDFVLVCM